MTRTIAVISDLKDVSELLAGASVDQARLSPSRGKLRLELALTRAMPERQTVVKKGFLTRTKTPWTKSRLDLDGVTDVSVERLDGAAGDTPMLNCEAVPGGYAITVTSHDGLRLTMSSEQLVGAFQDIGQPIEEP